MTPTQSQQFMIDAILSKNPDDMTACDKARLRAVMDAYLDDKDPSPITLPVPVIHLNGSGAKNLRKQAADVYKALNHSLDVMRTARPHGRDYYVEGGPTLSEATEAHRRAEKLVDDVGKAFLGFGVALR